MLVKIGKTYLDRAGSICKVVAYTAPSILHGTDAYYTYFPVEGGKENRDRAFWVDRYGSHLGEESIYDLVTEYKVPDPQCSLLWIWGIQDKSGIWAFGGHFQDNTPKFRSVEAVLDISGQKHYAWRCYLGPIPEIKKPLVKEELWFCQFSPNGEWIQFWVPEGKSYSEEFANCPDKHKTTTTRYV